MFISGNSFCRCYSNAFKEGVDVPFKLLDTIFVAKSTVKNPEVNKRMRSSIWNKVRGGECPGRDRVAEDRVLLDSGRPLRFYRIPETTFHKQLTSPNSCNTVNIWQAPSSALFRRNYKKVTGGGGYITDRVLDKVSGPWEDRRPLPAATVVPPPLFLHTCGPSPQ
jgi:hypothetical protein